MGDERSRLPTTLKIWDLESGAEIRSRDGHTACERCCGDGGWAAGNCLKKCVEYANVGALILAMVSADRNRYKEPEREDQQNNDNNGTEP